MALLKYTFDSPENPGLNRSMDFYNGYLTYQNGMKELHNRMNKIKKHLQMTQSFTENNFNDREGTPEGSPEYQRMAKALQNTLNKIADRKETPAEIERSLLLLSKKTEDYLKSAGNSNDPIEARRITGANVLKSNLPQIMNVYRQLRREVSMVDNEAGENYMNLPLAEVKEKALALEKEHEDDLEDMPNWKIKPDFHEMKMVSDAQIRFRKILHKQTKTFAENYNPNKGIDAYMTLKPKMSMTDLAKYYLCKKKMDELHRPGITPAEANTFIEGFSASALKKEYEALAKNPNFIRCMKQNPKTGFSKWEDLQARTDLMVKEIVEEKKNEGYQKSSVFVVQKHVKKAGFSYQVDTVHALQPNKDKLYKEVADLLTEDILTDPKNRYVAEAITMNPVEKRLLQMNALEFLKKGKYFDHVSPEKAVLRIDHLQTDPAVKESIVKNFALKRENLQKLKISIQPKQQRRNIAAPAI